VPANFLQPQIDYQIRDIGLAQVRNRAYLTKPISLKKRRDREYSDNSAFWHDLLKEEIRATFVVCLSDFQLFEWFPRSPGLYHTPDAARARQEAMHHVDYKFPGEKDVIRDHANPLRRGSSKRTDDQNRQIVFTPTGKLSMLQGGIGCIRLKPIKFPHGIYWFMSASSTGSPDEGIPVAVSNEHYTTAIEFIQQYGYCQCDLTGTVKFIDEQHSDLYSSFGRVPQMYIEIDDLVPARVEIGEPEVSVAVSFKSEFEGRVGVYAAYVTFNPKEPSSREEAVDWLNREYVKGRYSGEIITDFDQQATSFSRVLFSLETIMTARNINGVTRAFADDDALQPLAQLGQSGAGIVAHFYGEVVMGDKIRGDKITGDKVSGDKNVIKKSQDVVIVNRSAKTRISTTISRADLPSARSVKIADELLALKQLLLELGIPERRRNIESAIDEAIDETKRARPDKDIIGGAAERALKFATQADDFSAKVEKIVPRIKQVAGWLGENWYKLLPLVGVGISV
jgi:hypothetical protein